MGAIFGSDGSKRTTISTRTDTRSSTRIGSIGYSGATTLKIVQSFGKSLADARRVDAEAHGRALSTIGNQLLAAGGKEAPDNMKLLTMLGIGLALYQFLRKR